MSDAYRNDMVQDLRKLVDEMKSEAEDSRESPYDTDRARAIQQHLDAERVRKVLDRYDDTATDREDSR